MMPASCVMVEDNPVFGCVGSMAGKSQMIPVGLNDHNTILVSYFFFLVKCLPSMVHYELLTSRAPIYLSNLHCQTLRRRSSCRCVGNDRTTRSKSQLTIRKVDKYTKSQDSNIYTSNSMMVKRSITMRVDQRVNVSTTGTEGRRRMPNLLIF